MSHLYNNQSQSPVHSTPLHTGRGKGEGPLERVMRTENTTYKPYEKVTIATSQYRYCGTPVLTRRYSSTNTSVLQYQPVGTAVPVMQHQFRYWEAKGRVNGEQGNEVRKDSKRQSRIKTISHRTHRIHGTIQ